MDKPVKSLEKWWTRKEGSQLQLKDMDINHLRSALNVAFMIQESSRIPHPMIPALKEVISWREYELKPVPLQQREMFTAGDKSKGICQLCYTTCEPGFVICMGCRDLFMKWAKSWRQKHDR